MRHKAKKKEVQLRRSLKRRQQLDQKRAAHEVFSGVSDDMAHLVAFLAGIHRQVFETALTPLKYSDIKYALENEQSICYVAIDPPADCAPGYEKVSNASMVFLSFESGIMLSGKRGRGIYAINSAGLAKWLSPIDASPTIPEDKKHSARIANMIQLAAHEIRHEVQHFERPVYRKIDAIKDIKPEAFASWQNRTTSCFKQNLPQDRIDREEDAITTELLVQRLIFESRCSITELYKKIAELVRA